MWPTVIILGCIAGGGIALWFGMYSGIGSGARRIEPHRTYPEFHDGKWASAGAGASLESTHSPRSVPPCRAPSSAGLDWETESSDAEVISVLARTYAAH